MIKIQTILKDIESLTPEEQKTLMDELMKKVQKDNDIKDILERFRGIGKGVWGMDAQTYINNIREDKPH